MFKKVRDAALVVKDTAKRSQIAIVQSQQPYQTKPFDQLSGKSAKEDPSYSEDDMLASTAAKSIDAQSTGRKRQKPTEDLQPR